jgi:hypothetical protein
MMLRLFLSASVLSAVLAGSAAAQGVKIAGDPSAPPTAPAASAADAAPKNVEAKPKKKSSKPVKKKKPVESKYKTTKLAESVETSYRFDEDGNPLGGAAKKKPVAKAKSKPSSESEEKPSCSDEDSCSDKDKKSSDADAL